MSAEHVPARIDEPTIERIAARVATHLREELEAIAADLVATRRGDRPLTVDDVADRFGVARSTVYAHWREWGGYKLGNGEKASIRFPTDLLREQVGGSGSVPDTRDSGSESAKKRRRSLLRATPRLPVRLGDASPHDVPANSRNPGGSEA